jgi:hypothetical protein
MGAMAANPERHPLDDEIEGILQDNPGLREELAEFDRRYDAGEAESELIDDDEVRRDLIARGIQPEDDDRPTKE